SDDGIMPGMGRHHPVGAAADESGFPLAGSPRNRHSLAKDVVVAHAQVADGARIKLEILRRPAQDRMAVDQVVSSESRIPAEDRMLAQYRSGPDHDIGFHDAVGTDFHILR